MLVKHVMPCTAEDVNTFLRLLQPERLFPAFRNNPRLGASNTPFVRWLPAKYDDGISLPKGWNNELINNFQLPLVRPQSSSFTAIERQILKNENHQWSSSSSSQVRQVSNNILNTTDMDVVSDTEFSFLVTLFGQWNDHDITFTPFSPSIVSFSNGIDCDESCERTEPCIPIPVGVTSQIK